MGNGWGGARQPSATSMRGSAAPLLPPLVQRRGAAAQRPHLHAAARAGRAKTVQRDKAAFIGKNRQKMLDG
jgi:hypothetical protein